MSVIDITFDISDKIVGRFIDFYKPIVNDISLGLICNVYYEHKELEFNDFEYDNFNENTKEYIVTVEPILFDIKRQLLSTIYSMGSTLYLQMMYPDELKFVKAVKIETVEMNPGSTSIDHIYNNTVNTVANVVCDSITSDYINNAILTIDNMAPNNSGSIYSDLRKHNEYDILMTKLKLDKLKL